MNCEHEYKKTLSKSGMYFINMCHKCFSEIPFYHASLEDLIGKNEIYGNIDRGLPEEIRHLIDKQIKEQK